jgi:hypothetical protein
MRSAALFDLLPDFGTRPKPAEAAAKPVEQPVPEVVPLPDMGTIIAEAVARAEQEAEARLVAAHQAELTAQLEAKQAETDAFLQTLGGDIGAAVAARIDLMQAAVTDLVADQVARVVGGLLGEDLQKRSLAALANAVREAIGDTDAVRIRVSGPSSLYETLKTALGERAANLDFTDAPGFDLTVAIDDAVFETRMAEWSAALSEVLS